MLKTEPAPDAASSPASLEWVPRRASWDEHAAWCEERCALLAVAGALVTATGDGRAPARRRRPGTRPSRSPSPATGTNGESRALGDGLACDGATPVDDVHLARTAPSPARLPRLPGTLTANLGLAGRRLEPSHQPRDPRRRRGAPSSSGSMVGPVRAPATSHPTAAGRLVGNGCGHPRRRPPAPTTTPSSPAAPGT